jgi:hypothetical protein
LMLSSVERERFPLRPSSCRWPIKALSRSSSSRRFDISLDPAAVSPVLSGPVALATVIPICITGGDVPQPRYFTQGRRRGGAGRLIALRRQLDRWCAVVSVRSPPMGPHTLAGLLRLSMVMVRRCAQIRFPRVTTEPRCVSRAVTCWGHCYLESEVVDGSAQRCAILAAIARSQSSPITFCLGIRSAPPSAQVT